MASEDLAWRQWRRPQRGGGHRLAAGEKGENGGRMIAEISK
jgi:hypothetical protein